MPSTRNLPSGYNSAITDTAAYVKDFPLPTRASAHYTIRRRYAINRDQYTPLAINSADAVFTSAYLVQERELESKEQLKVFERLFSTIPAAWEETGRSIRYDYPGYIGALTALGAWVSSSVTAATDANGAIVVTKNSHGLVTGQNLALNFTANGHPGWQMNFVITAYTTNTFTLGAYFTGSWTFSSVKYRTFDGYPTRALRNEYATATILHEYFLPGISIVGSTRDNFQPLPKQVYLIGTDGTETTFLNGVTTPTAAEWVAGADAGEKLVAESEVRPYIEGGEILERVTTLIPKRR